MTTHEEPPAGRGPPEEAHQVAHRIARAVKAGTVWVNTYNVYDTALPFGGFKESGFGRDQGKDALEKYTQTKSVWVNL